MSSGRTTSAIVTSSGASTPTRPTGKRHRRGVSRQSNHWATHPVLAHLAGLSLVLLVLSSGAFLLLKPMRERLDFLVGEESRIEQLVAAKPKLVNALDRLELDFRQAVVRVQDKMTRIPVTEPLDDFLVNLSKIAFRSGTEVASVQPVGTLSGETAEVQVVNVQIRGSFSGLCRLLAECQAYPRPVWVTSLETRFDPSNSNPRSEQLRSIELTIQLPFGFHQGMAERVQVFSKTLGDQPQEA